MRGGDGTSPRILSAPIPELVLFSPSDLVVDAAALRQSYRGAMISLAPPIFTTSVVAPRSVDLSSLIDAGLAPDVGYAWISSFAEWLDGQRRASFAAQVSAMLARRQNRRELLTLVLRSLSDVWARLEEFGVATDVKRALNIVLVAAKKALTAPAAVARPRRVGSKQGRTGRSVLTLIAPNPPTGRFDSISIPIGLAV